MGAAAYNRGTALIRALAEQALGIRPPHEPKPVPRPATWGDKAREKALARARSILRGIRKYGLKTDVELLAGTVEMATRVSLATATWAATIALEEKES